MNRSFCVSLVLTALLLGCQQNNQVSTEAAKTAGQSVTTETTDKSTVLVTTNSPVVTEAKETETVMTKEPGIVKIAVFRNGSVEIDGQALAFDDAIATIQSASGSDTTVYYYREAPQEEPHPNAMKIIETVIQAQLALTFSSEPDFSTMVTPDGRILLRN